MFMRKKNRLKDKCLYQRGFWYFVTVCVESRKDIFWSPVEASLSRHPQSDNINIEPPNLRGQSQNHMSYGTSGVPLRLNVFGEIVHNVWQNLPNLFENIIIDEFVVMPNHFHGIIGFEGEPIQKNINKSVSLGDIISRFKNDSNREIINIINEIVEASLSRHPPNQSQNPIIYGTTGVPLRSDVNYHKIWQKSYFDHIIRDIDDLERIQEYILYNPQNWDRDSLNPNNI